MHRMTYVLNGINSQKARKILLHSNLISQFEQIYQGGSLIVRAYFPDGTNFCVLGYNALGSCSVGRNSIIGHYACNQCFAI